MDPSSGDSDLTKDNILHLTMCLSGDTQLLARLGLTCRYWYRGVWALQSHLNVTSVDAGVSLAKRKFIKEDTINSITIQEISYKTTFEPFLDRFVHRAPNLKRLKFWNPLSLRNDCVFHRIMFEFCGPKLEDICVGSRLKQDIDTALPQMWQVYRDIPLAPFKEALKKFHIGLRMIGGDTLAPLRACPNLEQVSFPETTFSTSELKNAITHWKNLKLLRVSIKSEIFEGYLDLATKIHSYFTRKAPLASYALPLATEWISKVVSAAGSELVNVICTAHASLLEISLQLYFSKTFFMYCMDLGLPLSVSAEHSALASVILPSQPQVLGFAPLGDLVELTSDAIMDIFDHIIEKGKVLDFSHATKCGTYFSRPQHKCNAFQAAILSGECTILDRVIKFIKSTTGAPDLHALADNFGESNVFHILFDAVIKNYEEEELMKLVEHVKKYEKDLGSLAGLLNTPDQHGVYVIQKAADVYYMDFIMLIWSLGATLRPHKSLGRLESLAYTHRGNKAKVEQAQQIFKEYRALKEQWQKPHKA